MDLGFEGSRTLGAGSTPTTRALDARQRSLEVRETELDVLGDEEGVEGSEGGDAVAEATYS